MINEILEKAKLISDEAEVLGVEGEQFPVQFENNKLKTALSRSVKGYALRIIKDGKIGFSSTTKPDAANELVEFALETAEFGQQASFEFPGMPDKLPSVKVMDPNVAAISVERLVEIGQEILDAIRCAEPDAQVAIGLGKSQGMQRLINTRGLDVSYQASDYSVGASIEIIRGTDMLQIWEDVESRSLVDSSKLAASVIEKARIGREIVPIDAGTMPVIFTPKGFAGTLALPITLAFNGKEVLQGATPVSDKVGQRMFDERLSIYDDGTIDFSIGSQPYDDEGLLVGRMPLIEKGVVSNFIYDLDSAAKAGKQSTANGKRGLGSLPGPGYNSIVIEPGDTSLEDMIKGIKYGLLIDQTMGSWTGNIRSGQISGNVHYGIKIENGELVGRVKDVMIACNVFEALNNIQTMENQSHWQGNLHAPHILFSALNVAS